MGLAQVAYSWDGIDSMKEQIEDIIGDGGHENQVVVSIETLISWRDTLEYALED